MRPAYCGLISATIVGLIIGATPVLAGIELITAPEPEEEQIDLDPAEYVPFSATQRDPDDDKRAALIRACDELAAHPGNAENPLDIKGLTYKDMDGSRALPACLEAVEAVPEMKRMRYQLARAKQASGQGRDAIRDLTELANEGYVAAINNLGATYQVGIGVKRDYTKALQWYEKAAEKDFVPSMAVLGWMYHSGRGTVKDTEKAKKWYRKAADGGSASAMHNLGHMYHSGSGGETNPEKAAEWFRRSAESGFGQGMAMTAWTYQVGRGVPADGQRAIEWYEKAAEFGELSALGALGAFYDGGGAGIARQPEKAAEWFVKGVLVGHVPTRKRLIEASNTLQAGTRRAIQARLNELGYDAGPPDGVFGRKTRDAIEQAFREP